MDASVLYNVSWVCVSSACVNVGVKAPVWPHLMDSGGSIIGCRGGPVCPEHMLTTDKGRAKKKKNLCWSSRKYVWEKKVRLYMFRVKRGRIRLYTNFMSKLEWILFMCTVSMLNQPILLKQAGHLFQVELYSRKNPTKTVDYINVEYVWTKFNAACLIFATFGALIDCSKSQL